MNSSEWSRHLPLFAPENWCLEFRNRFRNRGLHLFRCYYVSFGELKIHSIQGKKPWKKSLAKENIIQNVQDILFDRTLPLFSTMVHKNIQKPGCATRLPYPSQNALLPGSSFSLLRHSSWQFCSRFRHPKPPFQIAVTSRVNIWVNESLLKATKRPHFNCSHEGWEWIFLRKYTSKDHAQHCKPT